jgi:hypothetical protein
MVAGVVYEPAGHPVPETLNCVEMLLSMRTLVGAATKFAMIVLAESMVTVSGFSAPLADPPHPVN